MHKLIYFSILQQAINDLVGGVPNLKINPAMVSHMGHLPNVMFFVYIRYYMESNIWN